MSDSSNVTLPTKFENVAHEALISVWWTGIMLKKEAKRFFKSDLNSDAQFNILMILKYAEEAMSQNDLSLRLLVDKSNITGLVDRMEKLELIRRNPVPGDRRRYNITLTPKGSDLIDELEVTYQQRVQQIMKEFSDEECRLLVRLTTDLRRGIASLEDKFD